MHLVAAYSQPHRADILRARLESEGLHAVLFDEYSGGYSNGLSGVAGGVKVCIPDSEVGRLRELMAEDIALRDLIQPGRPVCPRCGSDEVVRQRPRTNWGEIVLAVLLLGLPLLGRRSRQLCRHCRFTGPPSAFPPRHEPPA